MEIEFVEIEILAAKGMLLRIHHSTTTWLQELRNKIPSFDVLEMKKNDMEVFA